MIFIISWVVLFIGVATLFGLAFGLARRALLAKDDQGLKRYAYKLWDRYGPAKIHRQLRWSWSRTERSNKRLFRRTKLAAPTHYYIDDQFVDLQKWLSTQARIWGTVVRALERRVRATDETAVMDKASERVAGAMDVAQNIIDYDPSPDDFYQLKTVKPAAIWTTFFAVGFTLFNFAFLYMSMGGRFSYLNTLFAGWAIVLIAVEIAGAAALSSQHLVSRLVGLTMLFIALCIEVAIAMSAGYATPILQNILRSIELTELPDWLFLFTNGLFGLGITIVMAYLWHNAFQKIQAARAFKAKVAQFKYIKNANRFLKTINSNMDKIISAGKHAQDEISKGKTSISTVWNGLEAKVEDLKSDHADVTDQVQRFSNDMKVSPIKTRATEIVGRELMAPIIAIAACVVWGLNTGVNYFLLDGVQVFDQDWRWFYAAGLPVAIFFLGMITLRDRGKIVESNDRVTFESSRRYRSLGLSFLILLVLAYFIMAMSRTEVSLAEGSNGLAQNLSFGVFGGLLALIAFGLGPAGEKVLISFGYALRVLANLVFFGLRWAVYGLVLIGIYVIAAGFLIVDVVFSILAYPWTAWGLLIAEAQRLRAENVAKSSAAYNAR